MLKAICRIVSMTGVLTSPTLELEERYLTESAASKLLSVMHFFKQAVAKFSSVGIFFTASERILPMASDNS